MDQFSDAYSAPNVSELLTRFVTEDLLDQDDAIHPDEDLLAEGMVDSLGMMRLVAFIEQELGYKVPPGDLIIENFRTIGVLNDYLGRKLGAPGKEANNAR